MHQKKYREKPSETSTFASCAANRNSYTHKKSLGSIGRYSSTHPENKQPRRFIQHLSRKSMSMQQTAPRATKAPWRKPWHTADSRDTAARGRDVRMHRHTHLRARHAGAVSLRRTFPTRRISSLRRGALTDTTGTQQMPPPPPLPLLLLLLRELPHPYGPLAALYVR